MARDLRGIIGSDGKIPGVVILRAMEYDDLPAVLAIEAQSQPAPWNEKIFTEELERDCARLVVLELGPCTGDKEATVVAFCNYWLVADEVQLLNIGCARSHRRSGYARRLMGHIVQVARDRNCQVVTLEVRKSNIGAICMYKQCGFEAVGVRPAYYSSNGEDAIVMLLEGKIFRA